jgi:hypothetical protein
MTDGKSFTTGTVFSHPSKVDRVNEAIDHGYLVHLHVILVPVDVAVNRVFERVQDGGHDVPERIRERNARLWDLIVNGGPSRKAGHRISCPGGSWWVSYFRTPQAAGSVASDGRVGSSSLVPALKS